VIWISLLTAECSTIELPGNRVGRNERYLKSVAKKMFECQWNAATRESLLTSYPPSEVEVFEWNAAAGSALIHRIRGSPGGFESYWMIGIAIREASLTCILQQLALSCHSPVFGLGSN